MTTFREIPVTDLIANDYNARRFEENMTPQRQARFAELVVSIREKGILEPLLVRPVDDGRFEVIAGERRYRAALQVADGSGYLVPCIVRDVDDDEAFDLMVIENLQREDLTPFETAQAFRAYLQKHGNSAEAASDLSIRTGIPVHGIRRQVRLLELPAEVLAAWKDGSLTQSHVELFTRLGDRDQTLELLATCQRLKLSVRELAERIGSISPELDRGFFGKADCQACCFNSSVQSGLFADAAHGGKCGNPQCFEAKQATFLTENWSKGKAAATFGTTGFRFGHRIAPDKLMSFIGGTPGERCRSCDAFITLIRLTGAVVSGYAQTCIGPRACFDEIRQMSAAASSTPEPEKEQEEQPVEQPVDEIASKPAETRPVTEPAAAPEKKKEEQKPAVKTFEDNEPVYSASRAAKFREIFFRDAVKHYVDEAAPESLPSLRLMLLALGLASTAARTHLIAGLGLQNNAKTDDLARQIFEIPLEDLHNWLQGAALAQIVDASVPAAVRELVANSFGADIARDWKLGRDYLDALTVSEIVRVGEEDGVGIWNHDKVRDYRKLNHKGKALRSLKKHELIDMILSVDGLELYGRVPNEILGKKG